jgi:hypothetical protein
MSRFYFNLTNNTEGIIDERGVELSDDDIINLADTIRELWKEEPALFDVDDGWRIEVVDDHGRKIGTFRIAAVSRMEALAAVRAVRSKSR